MTDEVEVFAVARPGQPAYWHRELDEVEILRHLDLIRRMERLQQEMRDGRKESSPEDGTT